MRNRCDGAHNYCCISGWKGLCPRYTWPQSQPMSIHTISADDRWSPVFPTKEQPTPASLLLLLLQIAGIETNPGPNTTWLCSVCGIAVRSNITSVQCNGCQNWCHMRKCTNLTTHRNWSSEFIASCCEQQTPPNLVNPVPPNNNLVNTTNLVTNQRATLPVEPAALRILQFNCDGINNKIDEIVKYMTDNDILLAAIQETKLSSRSKLTNNGPFSIVRLDRASNKGKGLAFIVHQSLSHRPAIIPPPSTPDIHIEQMGIVIKSGNTEITIVNIYIPPVSSCESGYVASMEHLLTIQDCLILGDINAHNELWFSNLGNDSRGDDIAEEIDASSFGVLNEDTHTRSPDISLASSSIFPSASWKAETALGSDHLPLIITLGRTVNKIESRKQTFVNFSKADWDNFTRFTEEKFRKYYLPLDVFTSEKTFRHVMTKAAKRFIPAGRIPKAER